MSCHYYAIAFAFGFFHFVSFCDKPAVTWTQQAWGVLRVVYDKQAAVESDLPAVVCVITGTYYRMIIVILFFFFICLL